MEIILLAVALSVLKETVHLGATVFASGTALIVNVSPKVLFFPVFFLSKGDILNKRKQRLICECPYCRHEPYVSAFTGAWPLDVHARRWDVYDGQRAGRRVQGSEGAPDKMLQPPCGS